MERSSADLRGMAAAGAGMIINGAKYTPQELRAIVTAASKNNSTVTIKNLKDISSANLRGIAEAGRGFVVFDFMGR